MGKTKHITRVRVRPPAQAPFKKGTGYADAALIRVCITITAELAAFHGCSEADPDGNNVHAEPIWDRHVKRGYAAIEQAAAIPATTWAGLASKAVAMTAILNDECGGMEQRSELFFRSFATDAATLCKDALDAERNAARKAEQIRANEAAANALLQARR